MSQIFLPDKQHRLHQILCTFQLIHQNNQINVQVFPNNIVQIQFPVNHQQHWIHLMNMCVENEMIYT